MHTWLQMAAVKHDNCSTCLWWLLLLMLPQIQGEFQVGTVYNDWFHGAAVLLAAVWHV